MPTLEPSAASKREAKNLATQQERQRRRLTVDHESGLSLEAKGKKVARHKLKLKKYLKRMPPQTAPLPWVGDLSTTQQSWAQGGCVSRETYLLEGFFTHKKCTV